MPRLTHGVWCLLSYQPLGQHFQHSLLLHGPRTRTGSAHHERSKVAGLVQGSPYAQATHRVHAHPASRGKPSSPSIRWKIKWMVEFPSISRSVARVRFHQALRAHQHHPAPQSLAYHFKRQWQQRHQPRLAALALTIRQAFQHQRSQPPAASLRITPSPQQPRLNASFRMTRTCLTSSQQISTYLCSNCHLLSRNCKWNIRCN